MRGGSSRLTTGSIVTQSTGVRKKAQELADGHAQILADPHRHDLAAADRGSDRGLVLAQQRRDYVNSDEVLRRVLRILNERIQLFDIPAE